MSFPVLTIEGQSFAVAPYFCLEGDWRRWLEVDGGGGWRPPLTEEIERWSREGRRGGTQSSAVSVFALPKEQQSSFWALLQNDGASGFMGFAEEVARYLGFKQLPPPDGAVFDLVVSPAGGEAELGECVWAVVNVADGEAFAVRGGMRVRLEPGMGCRVVHGVSVWGAEGEEPGLLLVVRAASERPD